MFQISLIIELINKDLKKNRKWSLIASQRSLKKKSINDYLSLENIPAASWKTKIDCKKVSNYPKK